MGFSDIGSGSGISIGTINRTISPAIYQREASFNKVLQELEAKGSDNLSQLDVLKVQQQLQQLNMFIEMQSTLVKTISESIKQVIQKSG